jgi:hypothetical protein
VSGVWMSKSWRGKSHFIVGGKAACADRLGPCGIRMGDLLKCEWHTRDPREHLCGLCRRVSPPVECVCGKCGVRAARRTE